MTEKKPFQTKILGYDAEEMVDYSFNSFTHPDDREGGRERWRQLLDGEVDFNRSEKRYIRKDGQVLLNMYVNAWQAIPHEGGVTVPGNKDRHAGCGLLQPPSGKTRALCQGFYHGYRRRHG